MPSLANARLVARQARGRAQQKVSEKRRDALFQQLGLSHKALVKEADADFAKAKAESLERLRQLRRWQANTRKTKLPLMAQIEAAFARFGGKEALR